MYRTLEGDNRIRKGLGIGLEGAIWLIDEFSVEIRVVKETIVTIKK